MKPRLLILLACLALVSCARDQSANVELLKKTAGELRDNRLYEAAVAEYEKILAMPSLDVEQQGSVSYLIAKICFEDLKDYERAAAYYVRARTIDPDADYIVEASKNLVACLEKLGQHRNASRQLRDLTDIDAGPADSTDVAVAQVGDRTIYMSEVEQAIEDLPDQLQAQLQDRRKRAEFVRQYAAQELLYRAALREGYDRNPDVVRARETLLRNAILDRFMAEKVMSEVEVDTLDVHNFYLAGKTTRYDDKPYDSVRGQVFMDYQMEKANAAFNAYINRLAKAERFEIYDQNIR